MWSRVVEVMLSCWLMMSPFVFQYTSEQQGLWANDFLCAAAITIFALLSYWTPTQHAHVGSLLVGGWLVGYAYWIGYEELIPPSQNYLILGLLLVMFAVIPNHASRPAQQWQRPIEN